MNTSKFTQSCRRIAAIPRRLVAVIRLCFRRRQVTSEAAERLDRIRNPNKYLAEVNATKNV